MIVFSQLISGVGIARIITYSFILNCQKSTLYIFHPIENNVIFLSNKTNQQMRHTSKNKIRKTRTPNKGSTNYPTKTKRPKIKEQTHPSSDATEALQQSKAHSFYMLSTFAILSVGTNGRCEATLYPFSAASWTVWLYFSEQYPAVGPTA